MELPEVRNTESPRDLLKDLGDIYLANELRSRDVIYGNLLREGVLKNEDKVHWREDFAHYCYNLRYRGFYDDTNVLEDQVDKLEEVEGEESCDRLMKFLTLLSGSIPHKTQRTGLIPTVRPLDILPHHVLPNPEGRYHGDTCASGAQSSGYLMYRDELFESVGTCPDIDKTEKMLSGFPENSAVSRFIRPQNNKLPPPKTTLTGLPAPEQTPSFQALPPPVPPFSDRYSIPEYGSSRPILADLPALPPPTITGIFKSLSHKSEEQPVCVGPVLRGNVKERYQPAPRNSVQRFAAVRPSNNLVSDSSGVESDDDHSAWEQAFQDMDKEFPTPTYELLGRKVLQERPYITEAGPQVYTRLCVLLCSPYSDIDMVTEKHVLWQCQYVLIGIPTSIFQFDKTKVEFVPLQNICYTGVSPDSLADCLYSIAYSGTLFLRLKMFCDQYSTVERYGNVVKGLVSAVERYLFLHQVFLSKIPITSLIQLVWKTKDLTSQLEFLCNLLLLEEGLPTGTQLIEYLYKTAEILTASPYYKIMLSLIRAAFKPYVKFLELWLCEGRVWDDWDEFNVSSHQEWMNNKDYLFWQYAFTEREEVKLPEFLEGLREQLVNTGKLINLFRLCVPDHPLSVSKIRPPKLQLTFNDKNITQNMHKWETYRDAVKRELHTQAVVREMKKKEEEERRIAKLTAAKEDARRRIAMIMQEAGALRAGAVTNKKQEVQRLQEQMLERAEQRAAMLEEEKREDRERIERNQTEQYELVGQVRAQLEDYYTSLTKEKAREERRSLWRIQRIKLNRLRRAHLMFEMSRLNQELRDNLQGKGESLTQDQVALSDVQIEGTAAVEKNEESSEEISSESRTRKVWEQPININIDIAVDEDESAKLQNISISSSLPGKAEVDESPSTSEEVVHTVDNGSVVSGNVENVELQAAAPTSTEETDQIEDTKMTSGSEEENKENEDVSDGDSEISFTLSPGMSDNHEQQKFEPDGQMKEILYGGAETEKTDSSSSKQLLSRLNSEGNEMKNILYSQVQAGESDVVKSEQPLSRLNSEGEDMKDILYSRVESDKTDAGKSQPLSRLNSEGSDMKNILYSRSQSNDSNDAKSEQPISRLNSEGSEMKDILYSKAESIKTDEAKSETSVSRLNSEGSDMKEILYSRPETNDSNDAKSEQPISRLNSEGSEMKDILYSKAESIKTDEAKSETSVSRLNSEGSDMKEILYSRSESNDSNDAKSEQPISRLNSEGSEMKEILYSRTSSTKSNDVVHFEPAGQMKELLYGDVSTSGYSSLKHDEEKNETESESKTETTSSKDVPSVDRMKEILYGQPQQKDDVEVGEGRTVYQVSLGDDSGIEMEYQIEPIRLSYPELDAGPNPNIMTERLTRYYVAEETPDDDEVDMHRTLEITLGRMLLQPLLLQTYLVNGAAVKYFVDELKINDHFEALRSYLCMSDGMFGDSLSKGIFNMIDSGMDLMTSPAKLNAVLHEAMECSKINNRLSLESVGNQASGDVLNCLVLRYDVDWPSNIIVTDNCLYKYNEIFKFLLKLKHGCFMLDKIWFLLGSVDVKGGSAQMRRLQVCRYEVSQCLHAVQIYMTHQLHNISWHELQTEIRGASSVSQLQQAHQTYLNNAMERLLLGESTRAPHEIILKIFKHVTLFVKLLQSAQFTTDLHGHVTHPHFDKIIQRHEDFTKQAVFILKVAESSNSSGYKPYIDEFMLRLDFNHYYQSTNPIVKRRSMAGLNLLGSSSKTKLTSSLSSPSSNLAKSVV